MNKLFLVLILLFSLTACKQDVEDDDNVGGGNNACSLDSDCDDDTTVDYLIKKNPITLDELYKRIDNKESFVLYMYFDTYIQRRLMYILRLRILADYH